MTYEYYKYNPSTGGAVFAAICFAVATTAHGWQMFRTRTWFFIPFFIGGICKFLVFEMLADTTC